MYNATAPRKGVRIIDLPTNASRDDILAALNVETSPAVRATLLRRLAAAPARPGIKIGHGAKRGETEVWEDGRWVSNGQS